MANGAVIQAIHSCAVQACILVLLAAAGCARLSAPAPDDPVQEFTLPPLEDSVISLPLTIRSRADRSPEGSGAEGGRGSAAERLKKFLNRQAAKFDEGALQNEYAQMAAGWAWDALQTPIKLKEDYYLALNPQALRLSLPQEGSTGAGNAFAVVELIARPKITAAPAQEFSRPTPSFSTTTAQQGKGFHLALKTELSFTRLSLELTERFKNKTYTTAGRRFVVENVLMYASGASAVLAARVSGDVEGTLYLSGIPRYDRETRRLFLDKLDYTLATRDLLATAAEWMLHSELRGRLEEKTTWPLGDRLDEARELLTGALNRDLGRHVSLSGTIARIELQALGLTRDAIRAVFRADGVVELKVF